MFMEIGQYLNQRLQELGIQHILVCQVILISPI